MESLSFFSSWQPLSAAPVGEQVIIATECGRVREGILMPSGDALVAGSILKPVAWMEKPEHPEVMIKELAS